MAKLHRYLVNFIQAKPFLSPARIDGVLIGSNGQKWLNTASLAPFCHLDFIILRRKYYTCNAIYLGNPLKPFHYNFRVLTLLSSQGMNTSDIHNHRIAKLTFASVYPMYLIKVEKKGRTKDELHQVIHWLTGFDYKKVQELIKEKVTFEEFFHQATLNSYAHLITGEICGYRIEEIENSLTQKVRYLDKLVDELAKGRKMEKILRKVDNAQK